MPALATQGRRVACLLGVLSPFLAGCDHFSLAFSSDGFLAIAIVNDGPHPREPFRVRARLADGSSRLLDLSASGQVSVRELGSGEVELTLLPPAGCTVVSPNPISVGVGPDETRSVSFDVHCG